MQHAIGLKRVFCLFALCGAAVSSVDGQTIRIASYAEWAGLEQRLQADPTIREVVVAAAVYHANVSLEALPSVDPAQHPLLIRVEEGAEVVLDGSEPTDPVMNAQPEGAHTGVFAMGYVQVGNEYPKMWEPVNRLRYQLVADVESVARFPATYTVEGNRLLFRTSDGQAPEPGTLQITHPYLDYAFYINRPYVTVRGFKFRNYLVREKLSTAMQLVADHVTVEDCAAENCSIGFIVSGSNCVVRGCRVEDCGGGVYVGGQMTTVENCRLFKRRDAFMVPMYAQDDAGIQFYYPAMGGTIFGNLCVGFGRGLFLKAHSAPYLIAHNTFDGSGQGMGFGATKWAEGEQFRYNLIVNCARALEVPTNALPADVHHNGYFNAGQETYPPIGVDALVADPKFAWPPLGDYRLANDSPALALADAYGPAGAFPALGQGTIAFGEPREWYVSETGRDGRDGTAGAPVKTLQFAVDRAAPGDTIIVQPGLYPEPVVIVRGGTEERPIVIRAAERWRAILDSNRKAPVMIDVKDAPYVEIRDLEIRWYGGTAIRINRSAHVTVAGCRIWNAHWYGAWPTGIAISAEQSPGFVGWGNVLFRQEYGFFCSFSPGLSLVSNTCVSHVYAAAAIRYSCENSVCRHNNFAFQQSDSIMIEEGLNQSAKLALFDCDYNNYGTSIGQAPLGEPFDTVTPREKDAFLDAGAKSVVNYTEYMGELRRFFRMQTWQDFSGLDTHSLFVDPLFVDALLRDFRLESDSPCLTGGKDGATIGALGSVGVEPLKGTLFRFTKPSRRESVRALASR